MFKTLALGIAIACPLALLALVGAIIYKYVIKPKH
jgi:hypothetical protein